MINEIFKAKHVGQKVHSKSHGNGVIIYFNDDNQYPIECKFKVTYETFDTEGMDLKTHKNPSLSFGHKEDPVFDYGTPLDLPQLIPLKLKHKALYAYVSNISYEDALKVKCKRLIVAKGSSGSCLHSFMTYYATSGETLLNDTSSIISWKYAVAIPKLVD